MNKIAIALLLAAGSLVSVQAHAADHAVIGAVEGAVVGSHFGGAHGAVAGAILGAVIGSSAEDNYYRRDRRDYGRYAPEPTYYAPPVAYEPYYEEPRYEARYEPRRVVYVQPPVYDSYPVIYAGYRAPVYVGRYASPRRGHYGSRHESYDHRRRY
ncbi:MAG: glycine zipper 2TM domain-containing protein [Betaproteobacteria bacterium]